MVRADLTKLKGKYIMTNAKIVKLSFGANEVAASEALGVNYRGQVEALKAFFNAVIVPHKVSLSDCLAPQADRKAGNAYGQAQYEFVRLCYATAIFGADMAKRILSLKSTDETKLNFGGAVSFKTGADIKPNTARYVMQNQLGKEFKEFLISLQNIANADADTAANADTQSRKKGEAATDAQYVADRITAIAKRLSKGAEKLDGSIDFDTAPKLAKLLIDVCVKMGVDVNKIAPTK
jgi:hypothetical protein